MKKRLERAGPSLFLHLLYDIEQEWANYGPPSNFMRSANNVSELARVVEISIFGFVFPLQVIPHTNSEMALISHPFHRQSNAVGVLWGYLEGQLSFGYNIAL